ncbi:alpha/beta hydrolase [Mycobacterium sp. C31M]
MRAGLLGIVGAGLIAVCLSAGAPVGWAAPEDAGGSDGPSQSSAPPSAAPADAGAGDATAGRPDGEPTEARQPRTRPRAVTGPRTIIESRKRTLGVGDRPARSIAAPAEAAAEPTEPAEPADAAIETPPEPAPAAPAVALSATVQRAASAEVSVPATVAAVEKPAETVTRAPSLLNTVGSMVLDALMGLIHLIDGPPMLPAGSTVTVRTSSLTVPIGAGRSVEANWYFPKDADESTRLIYLQHGFLASAPMYSYTAANLAERTNSIVVAPSLSSNFFSVNAEWVGGSTMQRAMADLFAGDRHALTESASAAAGHAFTLPERFALVGHSAGGTVVTAVAGYLAGTPAFGNLAGVVMLDGVEPAGSRAIGDALAKLTGAQDIPIYLISSQRYMWSRHGDMADKLMAARPGRFNGVALTDGMHIDYMEGGNSLLQFAEYVVSGFSHRVNIDAAGLITAGWVDDLFAGTSTGGSYGEPGDRITIDTRTGAATAVVLPLGPAGPSPLGPLLDPVLSWLLTFAGRHLFVYDPA